MVKTKLAEIEAAITAVKKTFAQAPHSLSAADLPAFVNFTGAATHDWRAGGSEVDIETRTYLLRLYVKPVGDGMAGEGERVCEPFFAGVRDYLAARPGLERLTGVQLATLVGDGGVQVFQYGGLQFYGIEFRLQVTELVEVVYVE